MFSMTVAALAALAALAGPSLISPSLMSPSLAGTREPATREPAIVTLPPANGDFDYQIGGAYAPRDWVEIVDRDRLDDPAAGKYNICYINGFQTQPGESGDWPSSVILRDAQGRKVEDPGWPGEYLLDTRTEAKRQTILGVVGPWMQDCKDRGFAAIEPDNLDSYTRSKRLLTRANNKAMAALYATDAHARGLAIAQKNDTGMAAAGPVLGFDFVIAEECQFYSECDVFTDVYGDLMFEIEYPDGGGLVNYQAACSARGSHISITYRDRNVVRRGRPAYVFKHC